MKDQEKRTEFIRLRAEGKSLRAIAEEIGVSKSALSEWDKSLSSEVSQLRAENLEELYSSYGMAKEGRIRALGETLRRIDTALEGVDLSGMRPEKLLEYKLRYEAALREEYTSPVVEVSGEAQDTLEALKALYQRMASGEITTDKAKTEASLIEKIVTGYSRARPLDELFSMM